MTPTSRVRVPVTAVHGATGSGSEISGDGGTTTAGRRADIAHRPIVRILLGNAANFRQEREKYAEEEGIEMLPAALLP